MTKMRLLTLGILLILLFAGAASAQIIKELPTQNELENFTANVTFQYSFTNVATAKAIEQYPTWPHDIWSDSKNNTYVSFYYANTSAPLGYTSVYFYDDGKKLPKLCYIKFTLVEKYPGLEVPDNTAPGLNNTVPVNNTTNETQYIQNNTSDPVHPASEISLYLKNETSGDSVDINANLQSQPSEGMLDKIKESIGNMIDAIFGGY